MTIKRDFLGVSMKIPSNVSSKAPKPCNLVILEEVNLACGNELSNTLANATIGPLKPVVTLIDRNHLMKRIGAALQFRKKPTSTPPTESANHLGG